MARKLSFLPTVLHIFDIRQYYVHDLLSLMISNLDKHEFSNIWKWISCSNDIMNDVDCIIKRDVYTQKMHSQSKSICGISFF